MSTVADRLEAHIQQITGWVDALNGDEHVKALRVAVFSLLRDLSMAALAPDPTPALQKIKLELREGTDRRPLAINSNEFRETPVGQLVFRWQRTAAEQLDQLLTGVEARG